MKTDFINRASFSITQGILSRSDSDQPTSISFRYSVIILGNIVYPLKLAAELVENVALCVLNTLGAIFSKECRYDALVYLRKTAVSIIKLAVHPFLILAQPILFYCQYKDGESLFDLYKNAVQLQNELFYKVLDFIPRPDVDKDRLFAAAVREIKLRASVDKTLQFFKISDGLLIPIQDEWGRYWKVSGLIHTNDTIKFTSGNGYKDVTLISQEDQQFRKCLKDN